MPEEKAPVPTALTRHLAQLRRYARALTGSQEAGDRAVRLFLEGLLSDGSDLPEAPSALRLELWTRFHAAWDRIAPWSATAPPGAAPQGKLGGAEKIEGHVRALPAPEREVLLLTTLGDFTLDDAARIVGVSRPEAEAALDRARAGLDAQTATSVLIIEDEPIIALDLSRIVTAMGHTVTGTADTAAAAVMRARNRRPGVVLADIQLRDGSSGIDAAHEILRQIDVPVIFVTAFPERLLTGERMEPVWLVTKPFDPATLRVTISQALLMHPASAAAEAG